MIVQSYAISLEEFADRREANAPNERSVTLHQSDIIKSLCIARDRERFDPSKPMDMRAIEMGFAFETVMESGLVIRDPGLVRPGEVTHLGITGSPDGLYVDTDPWKLAEYKATKMSCRQPITDPKFWHWLVQIKGYIFALNESMGLHPPMTQCWLYALFVNGDNSYKNQPCAWSGGRVEVQGSHLHKMLLTFTAEELQNNYAMLVKHARSKGWL